MGITDHLACLLKNLYAGQEATVRTRRGTTNWFQIGKEVCQGCVLSPCLFNLYAEYIIEMLGWMKHNLQSRLPGEISITSDTQMTPPLWQKVKKNWRASWWKRKRIMKKLRHYLANTSPSSQSYGFSCGHGCESWTIKKAEQQRMDAFKLWCWRKLLRVPWTARRSNQSIL